LTISVESKPYAFCSNCKTLNDVIEKNKDILDGSVQNLESYDGAVDGIEAVALSSKTGDGYEGGSLFFMSGDKLYTISYFERNDIVNKYEDQYREITRSFKLSK
jgi:hypothetical protein